MLDSLAAAEAAWRRLEERGVLTPYQRFDWVAAVTAAQGTGGGTIAVAVVKLGTRPVALLPLLVTSRWGLRVAEYIGADISNAGWMIVDPDFSRSLGRGQLETIFAAIGRVTGADLVAFYDQPAEWQGLANPLLAFPHQPAPDPFYGGRLGTDRLSANRIRNIMRGRRRLAEIMGPVRLEQAKTSEEIDAYHAAFLRQRSARFAEMGVGNVFAEDWFIRFFKAAARQSLGMKRPILRFHALFAGDEILATAFGTYSGSHYSQYINSTATEGPAVKYSLIGILLHELVEELRADGITSIDIGLGDFPYKELWAEKLTVYDGAVALSGKGRVAAPLLLGLRRLKRTIKQHPRLFKLAKRLRALARAGVPARSAKEGHGGK
ncbi:MAG TPA: GNAT family N-acetyltransferase [Devosiaceae bacterium]|nr:GNAT family N-acetyltransferase [Devosiaceae bacterium]